MPDPHHYGLILAGGRGTRFWPRSRRRCSKQVLKVFGERSLIQATVDRLAPLLPPERLWVLTNEHLRAEIVRQLPEIPREQVLAEPVQRNTAPAIGLAAHLMLARDAEAVMGVFPSDHVIAREARYRKLARAAYRSAAQGRMTVLGIQPRWAETGYGYVEFPRGTRAGADPVRVLGFREKPDAATARRYVAAGRFFWNAGMFFWRADVLLKELRRHLPRCATILAALPDAAERRFTAKLREAFPRCENISIDYGVLERAEEIWGIACPEIGWNDVGSWNAVYELSARDGAGNVTPSGSLAWESHGNYVDAGKTVALLGVENLVVVDTPDALLVADRRRSQQVGDIVKLLEKQKRDELL